MSPQDGIWAYIVKEGGNVAAADSVIDAITERFYLFSQYPRMGRARDDLRSGLRSFAVGQYVIVYTVEDEDVQILHVFRWLRPSYGLGYFRQPLNVIASHRVAQCAPGVRSNPATRMQAGLLRRKGSSQ